MSSTDLHTPIEYLKGVGPARADLLRKELGIRTQADLANFFPNRYIDRTQFFKINQLQQNSSEVQIIGKITQIKTVSQKRGSRLVATFVDETGTMELVWFRGAKWIKESLKVNTPYVAFGRVNWFNGAFNMPHPELELVVDYKKSLQTAMQPVYPSTESLTNRGITNRVIAKMLQNLFVQTNNTFEETLSKGVINKLHLISKSEALFNIHFPKNQQLLTKAQQRLKFEEFFFIQLQLIRKKLIHKSKIKGYIFEKVGDYFNGFYKNNLPFDLTNAQKKVLKEIRKDMATGAQMNRLLQGDVGSGKTIVALLTILIALDNGFQAALIAPTEILATQHYNAISTLLNGLDININLLTGSAKAKKRKEIHEILEDGSLHILIGTHALLEDKVKFKNLGLTIIDEQHRFGVAQRAKMWLKNEFPPHILVMTATPIPRTLAMSVYGDLDISIIDELPPGRKQIATAHRYDSNRLSVFKFMKEEIAKGRQVYVVYPLIQESQKLDFKDLMDGYESITREFPKPKYQISIVHGKMKAVDKEFEMNRFLNKETQIMVATTVIEVGVDIPNASVMVIESAERFGLSQLHQLRGRVGRGAEQSYCILMTSFKLTNDAKIRLETMVKTNDGFEIAEVDLKLRGPGDLMGTQQSGVLNLRIADIVKDAAILKRAREMAIEVLSIDPNLTSIDNRNINQTYQEITRNRAIWANIS
ncbi:MAG: ATP-dependent DNA helicase RecG [Flavobacteriaceae bacterium]|nr:ATP-dependent DNA helicase RecG [Flavobacteriaceae bacterium]